jgi:hypothetical protein
MPAKDGQPIAQIIGGAPQPGSATFLQGMATAGTLKIKMSKLNGALLHDITLKA